uniref:non-specific serine/threonine protein kinase n=1 Tax=Arion vulgaris TaxID=1028688 RepID=A0A0B7BD82_9EUPU
MPRRVASAAGAKRGPSAPRSHALPEEFPCGMLLKDLCKKEWHLGNVLGQGGFGLIYLASEAATTSVDKRTQNYVIKIEPKGNGPLFCETHFYQKVAKLEYIQDFVRKHKLKYLGIPPYIGVGIEKYKTQEYRFLVMPRLGTDLQKLLDDECGGKFAPHTTFAVALRIVDALQFLHEREYVHADIKAANILLGFSKGKDIANEVHLVDYGLAYRYTVGSEHKDYKEDLKRAHNGTIEFTSRDAHKGLAPSRRGDIEILGYCMIQWLCGKLPWGNKLTNPNYVAESKESFMDNLQTQITKCIPQKPHISGCMHDYLHHVNELDYHSEPNYNHIKAILKTGLTRAGQKDEWTVNFTTTKQGEKRKLTDSDSTEDTASSSSATPRKSPRGRLIPGPSNAKTPSAANLKKSKAAASKPAVSPSGRSRPKPNLSSPTQRSVPSSNGKGTFGSIKAKKFFPLPAPTKSVTAAATKTSTNRRVRRVVVSQSDTSVQTSPSLVYNI